MRIGSVNATEEVVVQEAGVDSSISNSFHHCTTDMMFKPWKNQKHCHFPYESRDTKLIIITFFRPTKAFAKPPS
jgi:hypothetical protein